MTRRTAALLTCFLVWIIPVAAQDPATGFPPYGSFQNGGFDAVNRQNLNVNSAIPIVSSPGRGVDFNFALTHNSLVWRKHVFGSTVSWQPIDTQWGWSKFDTGLGKVTNQNESSELCDIDFDFDTRMHNWAYTDGAGTRHPFDLDFWEGFTACDFGPTGPRTGYATDGSGYYLDVTDPSVPVVRTPTGHKIVASAFVTDANGNRINPATGGWRDTLGRDTLKISPTSTYVKYEVLDKNGTYQTFMLNLQTFNVKSNFGCAGIIEKTTTANLPISLVLPNNRSYTFEYEATPNHPGYTTGRIKKVILPTGGYYEYEYPDPNSGISCFDGSVKALKRRIHDGASTQEWDYVRTSKTIVTNPAGNQSTFTFNGSQAATIKVYSGTEASGTLLRTITNTKATNGTPASSTVVLDDDSTKPTSKIETDYDTFGNLLELREYALAPGSAGGLIRKTTNTYTTIGFIRNRATQTIVRDGADNIVSRTNIAYDTTALTNVTGAAQHDDTNYGIGFTARGNPTAVTTYTDPVTPSGGVTRNFYYDTLGNLRKADMNCCQQKEWVFSSATQYAYPDQVKSGPPGSQLITSATYNFHTGLVATSTDENGQQTTFTYDVHKRLTEASRPGPGSTTLTVTHEYDDDNRTITTMSPIEGTNALTRVAYFDQLGRAFKQSVSAPEGASFVETQFDIMGRPYKSSNPYRSGDTIRWTETQFDALGRPTKVIPPDGSPTANHTLYEYLGTTVTVTDPTGKKRKTETDAFGQLAKVIEPDVNNGDSLTQETSYAYSTLGLLTQVTQGAQTRSYEYDALGRLTEQTTPEAGTWSYEYNPFNLVTQRTDARGVDTNYTYDALNRLKTVSYDVSGTSVPSTATMEYFYDEGGAAANALGRLTRVTVDGANDETYQYDLLGRMTQVQKAISGTTYTMAYGYNLAGELTSLTYPSGRVVTQSYDTVGRLSAVQSGGASYASGFGYNAAGQVTAFNYGNGVAASFGYTPERLQLQNLTYSKAGQNLFSVTYCYWVNCDTQSGGNNGQITRITDSVDSGRTLNYTYDALHRLKTATAGLVAAPQWGLSWTYDRYGNRTHQTQTAGSPPYAAVAISPTTNRITEAWAQYDANGNMLNDGANTLAYDAENRVTSAAGATYSYDGAGLRVKKMSGGASTVYVFSGTKVVAEYLNGTLSKEYVYSGSALVATHEGQDVPGAPGTGTASVSGTLQTNGGTPATAGSGSATVNGSLQSIAGSSATAGAGSVNVTGSEQSTQVQEQVGEECVMYEIEGGCIEWQPVYEWVTYWDEGAVSVTVNGFTKNVGYGYGSTGASIATALANAFNADGASPVTASVGGTVVYLTSKATGAASNYALSVTSWTNDPAHFSGPSFVPVRSGPNLTGGANATPTTYDSGSVWVTVNGVQKSVGYGQGSTNTSVATALRDAINVDGGYPVSAVLSGSTLTLTARTTGTATNYSLAGGSSTSQPGSFSQPSFSVTASGSALTGGSDGTGVVYDTGSVWVTVNGVQKSVSYGQGSTDILVATALRDAINADGGYPVTAALVGTTLTLTARTTGAATNYSLAKGSSTSQPGTFPGPSFSVAVSGTALTGGSDGQQSVVKFHHHDHLSMRVTTDSGGNIVAQSGHYPYGESWYETGGANKLKFTSYERDSETGNDYAMFRSHVPRLGRFSRPDPIAGSIANPQSLNRYSYVQNNPVNATDPLGLFMISPDDWGGGGGGGHCFYGWWGFTLCFGGDDDGLGTPTGDPIPFEEPEDPPDIGDLPVPGMTDGLPPIFALGPQPEPNPCIDFLPPSLPTGVNIRQNVAEANERSQEAAVSPLLAADRPLWFYEQVRNRGPWDMKNQYGSAYVEFGNFHYGVVGTAAGFGEQTLLRAAGWGQRRAGTSLPQWGHPLGGPPYGDDPDDQEWIKRGIFWHDHCL